MATHLSFPLQFDGRGLTRTDARADWIRGLVEQVLFTAPGERVMRPDFGCGLGQLVFEPAGPELAAATQVLAQGALQQWLGNLITVEELGVAAGDGELRVTVGYRIRATDESVQEVFVREAGA